jgi:hypothetical protein
MTPNIRAKNGVIAFKAPDKELGISAPALANKYAGIKLPMVPEIERYSQSLEFNCLYDFTKKKTATEPAKTSLNEANCIGSKDTSPFFISIKALPHTKPRNRRVIMVLGSNFTAQK